MVALEEPRVSATPFVVKLTSTVGLEEDFASVDEVSFEEPVLLPGSALLESPRGLVPGISSSLTVFLVFGSKNFVGELAGFCLKCSPFNSGNLDS